MNENKVKMNGLVRWAIRQAMGRKGRELTDKIESIDRTQLDLAMALLAEKTGKTGETIVGIIGLLVD